MKPNKYYEVRQIRDLKEMLYSSAELFGEKPAFKLKNKSGEYYEVSFSKFRRETDALGTALYEMGLGGKRIALSGENCYSWALSYLAVTCGGGVIVPIDKELPPDEINNIIRISGSEAIICSENVKRHLETCSLPENVRLIPFSDIEALVGCGEKLMENGNNSITEVQIDPETMSILLFTSGTTGSAKGVMLSQRNICFNLSEMCQMTFIGPDDTFLSVLPLHHTYECTCGFLCPLYRGSSIAYCEKLSLITKTMQEVHPTVILCVPLLMDTMYKRIWAGAEKKGVADKLRKAIKLNNVLKKVGIDMSAKLFASVHENFGGKLRLLVSGGAAANPEVLKGLRDLGILAIQGYGLTECAPLAAVNRDIFFCDSSAGLATPHGAFDVFEPDQNGIGEIRYKGDNVMLGYYNAPELTAETIRDGWFYTGDSGFIDKDGFVHITGRKKNVIVTHNGKNIFPEEIEEYIARIPLVADSMVVGEEDGDDLVVKAIIYPNYEEAEKLISADPDTQEYKDALKKLFYERINEINLTLPPYKRIRRIFIRKNEFDRTTTKKIKRFSEENKHGEEL